MFEKLASDINRRTLEKLAAKLRDIVGGIDKMFNDLMLSNGPGAENAHKTLKGAIKAKIDHLLQEPQAIGSLAPGAARTDEVVLPTLLGAYDAASDQLLKHKLGKGTDIGNINKAMEHLHKSHQTFHSSKYPDLDELIPMAASSIDGRPLGK